MMQSSIQAFLLFFTRRNVLLASGLLSILAMLGFQWLQLQLGGPMLDMLRGYQRDQLFDHMLLYGAAGRDWHYVFTLSLDMVFPFIYGALFAGLLGLAAQHTRFSLAGLLVVPIMLVDMVENLQLAAMLSGFPELSDASIARASLTTQIKFYLIQLLFIALPVLAAAQWRARRLRN